MYRHTKLRVEMGYRIEDVESLLFFASVAMSDDNGRLQAIMFTECLLAYERGIGQLHVLDINNRQSAFCFVLDKYDTGKGAYHIHLLSVVKGVRRQGLGSSLIKHVLSDIDGEPVTLESQPESSQFFGKMGFSTKPGVLDHGLIAMFANSDGSYDRFKKLSYSKDVKKSYEKRYDDIARSLGF